MTNEPFSVSVNGHYEFGIPPEDAQNLQVLKTGENTFHLLLGNRSMHAELVGVDYHARTFAFRIGGEKFEVKIADRYERLIQELGLSVGGHHKTDTVKAPMPGLVFSILVEPGQAVQKGDSLLILEAMKMENVLKASHDGVVKSVKIQKGMAVDKGQLLLEFE